MSTVSLNRVRKTYGSVTAVDSIDLGINDGELITLLGPSGCGKTTTLRIIAGLIQEDSGTVEIDGTRMSGIPPWKRGVGMVFQNYALFPHLSTYENIAYGLRIRKWKRERIREQVERVADLLEISPLLARLPRELSGGQQQRVALARALAINPTVLLMDEPLTGLDAKLRERVRYELKLLQRTARITTIYVTHDQEEAFALADKIVVMNAGRIEQVGTPSEMYSEPKTGFVAQFLGTSNVLEGEILKGTPDSGNVLLTCEGFQFQAPSKEWVRKGQKVEVVIRTNNIKLAPMELIYDKNCFEGTTIGITFNGSYWKVSFDAKGVEFRADVPGDQDVNWIMPGRKLWATVANEDILYFAR